jgi:hypothetical protein
MSRKKLQWRNCRSVRPRSPCPRRRLGPPQAREVLARPAQQKCIYPSYPSDRPLARVPGRPAHTLTVASQRRQVKSDVMRLFRKEAGGRRGAGPRCRPAHLIHRIRRRRSFLASSRPIPCCSIGPTESPRVRRHLSHRSNRGKQRRPQGAAAEEGHVPLHLRSTGAVRCRQPPRRQRSMTKCASYVGISRILRCRPRLALNRTPKQMSPISAAPATGRSRTRSPSKSNAVREPIVEIRDRLAAERQVRYDRSTARHHQRLRPRTLPAENPGPSGVVLIHESVALRRPPRGADLMI